MDKSVQLKKDDLVCSHNNEDDQGTVWKVYDDGVDVWWHSGHFKSFVPFKYVKLVPPKGE